MYHIPADKRAVKSAEKISRSLVRLIHQKDFLDITVKEITAEAGVGRATFYRLFDNIIDVLYWSSERVILDSLDVIICENSGMQEVADRLTQGWENNRELLEAIVKIPRMDILFDIHLRHIDEIERVLLNKTDLCQEEQAYMASLLSVILPVTLYDAVNYPAENPREYYARLCKNIDDLNSMLKNA